MRMLIPQYLHPSRLITKTGENMPCDSKIKRIKNVKERQKAEKDRAEALKKLDAEIEKQNIIAQLNANNEVELVDPITREPVFSKTEAAAWYDDGCALAALSENAQTSWFTQQALTGVGVKKGAQFQTVGHGHPHSVKKS